jgi:hypothetical protein
MGDMGYLMHDLVKKDVWRVTGSNLQIVFVGSKKSFFAVLPQLLDENASYEWIGNTYAVSLSRKANRWFEEGCDLAIFELSRLYPFRPQVSVSSTVPNWVNQVIVYPEQMNKLLAGNRYNSLRRNLNKSRKAGCEWRFSTSREDFDFFYEHLYVPFIRSRHGESALVAPYPFQWDFWIKGAGGGLVLVTQAGKTVAGAVCLVSDDVCYNIEVGVLDADETLLRQGIIAFLFWAVAEWGKEKGAKFYNMGGTLGWRSNGSFRWKAKWGARVIRRGDPYRTLSLVAGRISAPLIEKLNAIGFVCEARKGFYGLILDNEDAQLSWRELEERIVRSQKEGLSGVCVVAPDAGPRFYDDRCSIKMWDKDQGDAIV